ncbi:multicopper oxidase domain-containing protein [Mycolicibacterium austroafricanum]|uniref:Copper-containing nitrite reductase n=1 Tax=Mycolicibacterium austroafricanum TaxID=39687 RepID=A0ABT8HPQ8_MYCAO|nr:multicopper oxidase domain-containing protein [Mycolicibacterium austroafricanum]MDN4522748.1 multicopper oxidase domain-containing protein [Mycolicibacterium austroafricanum]QRZ06904.1 multicopper oxidase domain-containing protein [Mycolicibacterium austroafricanum]QZT68386.1 multicopper oxidase domain-containing protein [Mycolicibacterium austroafricanum]
MNRSGWHLRVGTVVFAWLVAVLVVALAHRAIPLSGWLLVHLLGLGAAGNAILIWSRHFADALLRRPPVPARTAEVLRIAAFNAGAVAVIVGMLARFWPVVLVGGVVVGGAGLAHGATLLRQLRTALPARFGVTVRYYVAATACLAVGAGLGVAMANSALPGTVHERLFIAHAAVNVFGWVGLTVLGTLVTLWPTMLRTRMAAGVEAAARRGLPVLLTALAVAVAGAVSGSLWIAGVGAASYLGATGLVLWPHLDEIRRKRPTDFATLSVLAGVVWLIGSLVFASVALVTSPTWPAAAAMAGGLTAPVLAGFLVQVLLGSLTYLAPVVIGRRSAALAAAAELERGAPWRLAVANAGLLLCVLPTPSLVRVAASALVLASYAVFLPLLVRAAWRAHRDRGQSSPQSPPPVAPMRRRLGVAAAGFAAVVLAAAGAVAADPASVGIGTSPGAVVAATGHTTTATVRIQGMRFVPDSVEVPAGDRLQITLVNSGTDPHDLVLDNGTRTGRIAPGESAVLDAGVIGSSLDGWCAVAGHRQMGMTFTVRVTGAPAPTTHPGHDEPDHSAPMPTDDIARSLGADPGPGFVARDAAAPPTTADHRITLPVTEVEREVSPGITQRLWTFGGTAPGPTLRGQVGDVFEITLVNDGTIGHSIDFHAGALAPDEPMRTIQPGERLVYRFTATRAGIWLYHCSTMPMSLHIANGMFGAVIIDPPILPPVDREFVLVQSEMYPGAPAGEADADKVAADRPDLVVFNGYARQYDHAPLTARVGERVRIWVLAAGPNRGTSFHVVGGQFDTVWTEGEYRLRPGAGGAQALGLFPAQGGFVEMSFDQPGRYPFVSHMMVDAERGAHGIIEVSAR